MPETQWQDSAQAVLSPTLRTSSRPHLSRNSLPHLLPQVGNTAASDSVQRGASSPTARKGVEAKRSFKVLESWVAKVETVDEVAGTFAASIASEQFTGTRELADFTFDELSEDDRSLVQQGAIFYWSVGYQIDDYGGRSTSSVVRFRRVRHWKPKEIEAARQRASEYTNWFLGEGKVADGNAA